MNYTSAIINDVIYILYLKGTVAKKGLLFYLNYKTDDKVLVHLFDQPCSMHVDMKTFFPRVKVDRSPMAVILNQGDVASAHVQSKSKNEFD